jgi:4-alpha-glucanotransferase
LKSESAATASAAPPASVAAGARAAAPGAAADTAPRFSLRRRACGVLLHPTSLPGPHGCGDLGPAAREFVDFLADAGQTWWQMLPTGPVHESGSPYSSDSAFAGNPLLVNLDALAADGLLSKADLKPTSDLKPDRVRYAAVEKFRMQRLRKAFAAFVQGGAAALADFQWFSNETKSWLPNYAMFAAIRHAQRGKPWIKWPPELRLFDSASLFEALDRYRDEYLFHTFVQYQFARQWAALRQYATERGVGLIGDIPLFVAHDSADVWSHRPLFDLDEEGRARTVSGVPPDMFSRTGQLWGHPQYAWERHLSTRFEWWVARFRQMFEQFDAVRIDHFLGFTRVWAVPGRDRTAKNGTWVATPGERLFDTLQKTFGRLPIIAEDLGPGIPAAYRLRDRFGFPGMRLLHFAFGESQSREREPARSGLSRDRKKAGAGMRGDVHGREHAGAGDAGSALNLPHNHVRECVVYPGTHDNDTTAGWWRALKPAERRRAMVYLGTTGREVHWDMIRCALSSVANTAIIPMQDLLGLGSEARMNTPARARGNWEWRMKPGAATPAIAKRLRELVEVCGRLSARDRT